VLLYQGRDIADTIASVSDVIDLVERDSIEGVHSKNRSGKSL